MTYLSFIRNVILIVGVLSAPTLALASGFGGGGGGAADGVGYDQIQEEGTNLTKRAILNFVGPGFNCADNAGDVRTDCTWVQLGLDASFDVSGGNTITGATQSKKLTFFASDSAPNDDDGWVQYYNTSTGRYIHTCVKDGVENDCIKRIDLNSGFALEVYDSTPALIFKVDEATGYAAFRDERHFPVATCQNATASVNFDTPTTNAPTAACDTGTNTQKGYLEFNDTTDESFQDSWILPASFQGTIDVHFRWKAAAITGAVGWCAQLIRVPDGSTSDPAFPAQAAANCVSDTAKGTTLQENTATISGVTCTSCAAGDHVYVRISRDADGGAVTDSMTGDAFLLMYGRTIL